MAMAELVRAPDAALQKGHNEFGVLPEWDLSDLYPGAIRRTEADLDRAKTEAKAFEADYKGKLDGAGQGGGLVEAVARSRRSAT